MLEIMCLVGDNVGQERAKESTSTSDTIEPFLIDKITSVDSHMSHVLFSITDNTYKIFVA